VSSFAYTARDKAGAVTKGSLYADDRAAAAASLIDKGLTPIILQEAAAKASSGGLLGLLKLKPSGRVKLADKVVFSRQFATMINAGVPITKSLAILREQTTSKAFATVIGSLASQVESGSTLAKAMSQYPKVFSPVFINMVKAGETGGILDEVLERLAVQQEKDAEIVSKVRGAMIYPGVITTATIAAFFFLMTVIVPKLGAVFEGLGAELPIYTRVLLAISHALVSYGIYIGIVMALGITALVRYIRTPRGKHVFDTLILKVPIFGNVVRKVNIARFARTFGSLMSSGIAVLDALNSTADAIGNSVFRDELLAVAHEVKNGKSISEELRKSKNFPPIVAQMTAVGEETGKLDEILVKLAEFYEKEVDTIVASIASIIEPVLIIVIGVMVGFVVISVFGPLSALSNAV
jgi:type IV pilus assembly protein PilC